MEGEVGGERDPDCDEDDTDVADLAGPERLIVPDDGLRLLIERIPGLAVRARVNSRRSPRIAAATNAPSTMARVTQATRVTVKATTKPSARAIIVGHRRRRQRSPGGAPPQGVTGPNPIVRSSMKDKGTARRLKKGSPTPTWVPVKASSKRGRWCRSGPRSVDGQQQVVDQEGPHVRQKSSIRGELATRCDRMAKRVKDPTSTKTRNPRSAGLIAD